MIGGVVRWLDYLSRPPGPPREAAEARRRARAQQLIREGVMEMTSEDRMVQDTAEKFRGLAHELDGEAQEVERMAAEATSAATARRARAAAEDARLMANRARAAAQRLEAA